MTLLHHRVGHYCQLRHLDDALGSGDAAVLRQLPSFPRSVRSRDPYRRPYRSIHPALHALTASTAIGVIAKRSGVHSRYHKLRDRYATHAEPNTEGHGMRGCFSQCEEESTPNTRVGLTAVIAACLAANQTRIRPTDRVPKQ
jgi:hypothetical protein